MINFQFRVVGGSFYPQFRVQSLSDALVACLFVLCDLKVMGCWYVALSSMGEDRQSFPNIHIQELNGKVFFQVFVDEWNSPDGEAGWFTLFEDQAALKCQPFSLIDELNDQRENFFNAEFSQGLAFNNSFLVSKKAVIDHVKRFSEVERSNWVVGSGWLNLGLI
jgi:hypothetical protein